MTREEQIEDIRLILHKIDLVNRPYIVYLHPDDAEVLKTEISEIEKKSVIQITPFIEKGKCVCMLREKLEELWTPNCLHYEQKTSYRTELVKCNNEKCTR